MIYSCFAGALLAFWVARLVTRDLFLGCSTTGMAGKYRLRRLPQLRRQVMAMVNISRSVDRRWCVVWSGGGP